jgi:hypothetical protein
MTKGHTVIRPDHERTHEQVSVAAAADPAFVLACLHPGAISTRPVGDAAALDADPEWTFLPGRLA